MQSALAFPTSLSEAFAASNDFTFPEPVRFPRKAVDQRFAVLLVRSVYDAVDAMDFIPMDEFQARFWKLRQSQYEPYLLQYSPLRVRQGDLSDPLYFDFISFAQVATINQEIPRGRQVFKEYCESCEGQRRYVTRNPLFKDNALLPAAILRSAGDGIFAGLKDGFRGEEFGGPQARPSGTHVTNLAQDVQTILDIFVAKGYALKATVSGVTNQCSEGSCEYHGAAGSSGGFQVRLDGPANLWSLGALASQGAKLHSGFEALAIEAFLRASGVEARFRSERTPTSVNQTWTLG